MRKRQIHLDFHTPSLPFQLGKEFDKKAFQQTLLNAHVDSITLTGRCHHGHIYYDTKLPARHPQMQGDFLMDQIDAVHEVGIKAPVYLTVGWDSFSADSHREWLQRSIDGSLYGFDSNLELSPGWKMLCFNSDYLEYLKAQIIDTILHVGPKLDGLFFDILWQNPCYCPNCIQKMTKEGFDPENKDEVLLFAEKTQELTKKEIYEVVREYNKECTVFFNEGNVTPKIKKNMDNYSHIEIESLPSGYWGYQHFPITVRYAKTLNNPYLGMTAKFHQSWADFGSLKNEVALEYETMLCLAHGAGCSIGDQLKPQGVLEQETYDRIGKVYGLIEKYEHLIEEIESMADIAIMHPECSLKQSEYTTALAGAVNSLNESHLQFDIIDDQAELNKYRLLILVDDFVMDEQLNNKLEKFVNQGGKIFSTYQSALLLDNNFPSWWPCRNQGKNQYNPSYFINDTLNTIKQNEIIMHSSSLKVVNNNGKTLAYEGHPFYQRNYAHYYSHYQAPLNKKTTNPVLVENESVIYSTFPLFSLYKEIGNIAYKQIVIESINRLLGNESVFCTSLPSTADFIVNHQPGHKRLILTVLHYIPERRSLKVETIEEKIPLFNQEIEVNLNALYQQLNLEERAKLSVFDETSNQEVSSKIVDGKLRFTIEKIDGFNIISINYE
ncbi:alpha-amylase family protein [Vagococcus fluvialis]|uniref:Beta-galactosidase trimerisation domain-containing protein n=1 Tax=Vagococcus fluvialis TaxID=2738 RepID=A0A7X6I327_9ENTE|nr:alpha-amylase family protein [Vagococcus fluvialis]NKC68123.1 hypothetical protein [Vagococcus fluvialis]